MFHRPTTVFSEPLPAERPARWALASTLIADWFGAASQPMGASTITDLEAAEHRLGLALPAALREWHLDADLGHRQDVWSLQDHFLPLDRLRVENDQLIFCRENQNVVQWGIPVSSLCLSDPPVIVSDSSDEGHHIAAPSISEFALQVLAVNAKFSQLPLPRANGQLSDEAILALERHFPRLPIPDLHWPPFPTRLYGNERLVVEIQGLTRPDQETRQAPSFSAGKESNNTKMSR